MPVYREQPVAGLLRERVECCWSIETHSAIPEHRVVPDGCVDIVYRRGEGIRAVGAMRCERQYSLAPGTCSVGVRFRPGRAAGVLGISAAELTDRFLDLADLWPRRARELLARIEEARCVGQISQCLLAAIQPASEKANPVPRAIGHISEANGNADLPMSPARRT